MVCGLKILKGFVVRLIGGSSKNGVVFGATLLCRKNYDRSAKASVEKLDRVNGMVSGEQMAYAIVEGTRDTDGQAAGLEFSEFAQWAAKNEGRLSPEAKKMMNIYKNYATSAMAHNQTGISASEYGKMCMQFNEVNTLSVLGKDNFSLGSGSQSQLVLQALNSLCLNGISNQAKAQFVYDLGCRITSFVESMPSGKFEQLLLEEKPFLESAANHGLQSFGQLSNLGKQLQTSFSNANPVKIASALLVALASNRIKNFDPSALKSVPSNKLTQLGNELIGQFKKMEPQVLGKEFLASLSESKIQELGRTFLSLVQERQGLGKSLLAAMKAAPMDVGKSVLTSLDNEKLSLLGNELFDEGFDPSVKAADKFVKYNFENGKAGERNLAKSLGKFSFNSESPVSQILKSEKFDNKVLKAANDAKEIGNYVRDTYRSAMKLVKKGSVALDIAKEALKVFDGHYTTKENLKKMMNLVPLIGPALGFFADMPVVGKYFGKILSKVDKFLNKVPVVGDVLRGFVKGINFVGRTLNSIPIVGDALKGARWLLGKSSEVAVKAVKGVIDGVKTAGKAVFEGVKNVGKKIGEGIKDVGEKIGKGVKNVAKKVWKGIKKY